MGNRKSSQRILVGRPEGKGPLGIPGLTWDHNIKVDLQEVGFRAWTQDMNRWRTLVNAVTNLRIP